MPILQLLSSSVGVLIGPSLLVAFLPWYVRRGASFTPRDGKGRDGMCFLGWSSYGLVLDVLALGDIRLPQLKAGSCIPSPTSYEGLITPWGYRSLTRMLE